MAWKKFEQVHYIEVIRISQRKSDRVVESFATAIVQLILAAPVLAHCHPDP